MEIFSALLAICVGNSPHKGQWHGAWMFPLICTWINLWVNNRVASDLRRRRAHCDATVMKAFCSSGAYGPPGTCSRTKLILKWKRLRHRQSYNQGLISVLSAQKQTPNWNHWQIFLFNHNLMLNVCVMWHQSSDMAFRQLLLTKIHDESMLFHSNLEISILLIVTEWRICASVI